MDHWTSLERLNKDLVIIGDMNLCYLKWNTHGDSQQGLIDTVKHAQVSLALQQMVQEITRTQLVNETIVKSIIDHAYTNCQSHVTSPQILPVGDSDHVGIVIQKVVHQAIAHPQTISTRSYMKTDLGHMLHEIHQSNINSQVTSCPDLNTAASTFTRLVCQHLDKHAPVRTIQVRKSKPFISTQTRDLIIIIFLKLTFSSQKYTIPSRRSYVLKYTTRRSRVGRLCSLANVFFRLMLH